MFRIITIVLSLTLMVMAISGYGQDPRERTYLYPVLRPSHEIKPKVEGWATHRMAEKLDRGVNVIRTGPGTATISWRLLAGDPATAGFNVYLSEEGKKPVKLNQRVVIRTTGLSAALPRKVSGGEIFVRAIINGVEQESSPAVSLPAFGEGSDYHTLRFRGDYRPQRMAIADLNGDGALDYVFKQPEQGIDPGGEPNTDGLTYTLEAYLHDGTFLWSRDLGPGIEPGIWYSPFVVYDLDGDGKAEIAVKTGPPDAREADGRVRSGPEWISVWNGMTGREICRADWPARNPRFGDYNRNNRNQIGVAFLDGKTPCLLVARGTYKLMVCDAYQLVDSRLDRLWHWDGDEENPIIRHQGAHNMHAADVDGDGRDEIVLGSVVLDDNGTALWSAGLGHPDKCFVTDIDPERPGLEIFYAMEDWHDNGNGICMADAKTGEILWNVGEKTYHVGDGMVADILPEVPGLECFASEDPKGGSRSKYLLSAKGQLLARNDEVPPCRNWIWWDADNQREPILSPVFDFGRRGRQSPRDSLPALSRERRMQNRFSSLNLTITRYKGDTLTTGIRGSVLLMADILGDWREELITVLPGEMRIYSTIIPARDRKVCLLQDPFYRSQVVHRSMGYEQSPVPSYYLGE